MARRVLVSLGLIVVLLVGGTGALGLLWWTRPSPPRTGRDRPALLVEAVTLEPRTVVEPILGYATARADRAARVAAEVSGQIVEVSEDLHIGRAVRSGQVLVRIDDREYRRRLERSAGDLAAAEAELARLAKEERNTDRLIGIAQSELDIAEREYQRVLALFEDGQAPRRELDLARQEFERARRTFQVLENEKTLYPDRRSAQQAARDRAAAEVALAELSVERCAIRAPFDGRVEAVSVDLGERVSSGDPLFAVLDPQRIEVPVELPVSVRDRVRTGARARLTIDSNPGVAWQARVARIAPRADESTRTFSVYVELNNSQQESPLLPGMFVRATIEGPTLTDALLVPRQSIQRDSVFVFDDGVARRRPVRVRRHVFDESIVDGVEPGETVIVSNLDLLHDGLKVQVRPLAPATAGEQPDAPSTAGDGGESRLPSSGAQGRIAHENGSQGT